MTNGPWPLRWSKRARLDCGSCGATLLDIAPGDAVVDLVYVACSCGNVAYFEWPVTG